MTIRTEQVCLTTFVCDCCGDEVVSSKAENPRLWATIGKMDYCGECLIGARVALNVAPADMIISRADKEKRERCSSGIVSEASITWRETYRDGDVSCRMKAEWIVNGQPMCTGHAKIAAFQKVLLRAGLTDEA